MLIRIIDRKTNKVFKTLLVIFVIYEALLVFYALFGDTANLAGFQFLNTSIVIILAILGINLDLLSWLIKRSYSSLIFMNIVTLLLCIIFFEHIRIMFSQLIKSVGKRLCGEDCYDK